MIHIQEQIKYIQKRIYDCEKALSNYKALPNNYDFGDIDYSISPPYSQDINTEIIINREILKKLIKMS